jgi:hypothetical protein
MLPPMLLKALLAVLTTQEQQQGIQMLSEGANKLVELPEAAQEELLELATKFMDNIAVLDAVERDTLRFFYSSFGSLVHVPAEKRIMLFQRSAIIDPDDPWSPNKCVFHLVYITLSLTFACSICFLMQQMEDQRATEQAISNCTRSIEIGGGAVAFPKPALTLANIYRRTKNFRQMNSTLQPILQDAKSPLDALEVARALYASIVALPTPPSALVFSNTVHIMHPRQGSVLDSADVDVTLEVQRDVTGSVPVQDCCLALDGNGSCGRFSTSMKLHLRELGSGSHVICAWLQEHDSEVHTTAKSCVKIDVSLGLMGWLQEQGAKLGGAVVKTFDSGAVRCSYM